MHYLAQPAFVLHAWAYRETSLLVEVLSRDHGRVGLLARGVRGPRQQALRAALQPFQSIQFDAVQRGELAQLRQAEAVDAPAALSGVAAMAVFYINELVLRLAQRLDPQPELHVAYARVRARLQHGEDTAWSLRRFEVELLEALGLGLPLGATADGRPLDPAARYRLDPEAGPYRATDGGLSGATGRALLLLAQGGTAPPAEELAGLRPVLREVLLRHLGGRGLRASEVMHDLERGLRD